MNSRTAMISEANRGHGQSPWCPTRLLDKFIDPAGLRAPLPETVLVAEDGTITVGGNRYTTIPQHPSGTVLLLRRDRRGNLLIALQADLDRHTDQQRDRIRDETAQAAAVRQAAVEFNANLHVPVGWVPASNPRVSGHWYGDGAGRADGVTHIRLMAPLTQGRLHRERGWFLCKASGKWGELHPIEDVEQDMGRRVTCKSCLRLAARWA